MLPGREWGPETEVLWSQALEALEEQWRRRSRCCPPPLLQVHSQVQVVGTGVRSLPCCCQWREACLANFQVAPCPGLGCRSLSGPQPFHPWILQLTTTAAACAAAVAAAAAAAGASTPRAQSFDGEGGAARL